MSIIYAWNYLSLCAALSAMFLSVRYVSLLTLSIECENWIGLILNNVPFKKIRNIGSYHCFSLSHLFMTTKNRLFSLSIILIPSTMNRKGFPVFTKDFVCLSLLFVFQLKEKFYYTASIRTWRFMCQVHFSKDLQHLVIPFTMNKKMVFSFVKRFWCTWVESQLFLAWFVVCFPIVIKILLHVVIPTWRLMCHVLRCPYSLQCNEAQPWGLPFIGEEETFIITSFLI